MIYHIIVFNISTSPVKEVGQILMLFFKSRNWGLEKLSSLNQYHMVDAIGSTVWSQGLLFLIEATSIPEALVV